MLSRTVGRPSPASSPSNTGGIRSAMSGQALVLFAFFSLVLVGFMALAVDGGFILAERRQVQSAADAGAMAAAKSLSMNRTAQVVTAGQHYGGELNGGTGATANVNWPPSSGPHAGDNQYVEVIVTKQVRRFFLGAIYDGPWQVTARAVAGVEPIRRPYALVALDQGGGGMHLGGTVRVNVGGQGSVMSNRQISRTGTSNVYTVGGAMDATGTIDPLSTWQAPLGFNSGMSTINDPLAALPPPPVPSVAFTTSNVFWNDAGTAPIANCDTTCTMKPGYYNNLDRVIIKGHAKLAPGIYYFNGNTSLELGNTNAVIEGNKVMFYVTGSASLRFHNGGMKLFADPVNPAYPGGLPGMLLWIENCTTFRNSGNGDFEVQGVIYAPCSTVNLYGGGTSAAQSVQVIAGSLTMQGSGYLNIAYTEWVEFDQPRSWLVE